MWGEYEEIRGDDLPLIGAPGIGTPDDYTALVKDFESAGVDQVIFLQQGGKNEHKHICESLELFAEKVLPDLPPLAMNESQQKTLS